MTETEAPPTSLLKDKHKQFIKALDTKKDDFEYWVTEHLRMNGMYWGITAMHLMKSLDSIDREGTIAFIKQCQHDNGGFGGNIGHDPHVLYTLSAVQMLLELDALDQVDKMKIANYVLSLRQPDGSFVGDEWKEVDTRFPYIACSCLSLMGLLHLLPEPSKTIAFINRCKNFDGAFGCIPGAESHAGQTFCCVAALAILGGLNPDDFDQLGWWLCERQVANGGLNGRPEKKADVCYSWWVLSSLCIIDRLHWIDCAKLRDFIYACQDSETGGIADMPGDLPDVFHCYFGIGGLSLMGYDDLRDLDPAYALGVDTLEKYNIQLPWKNYKRPQNKIE